MRRVRSSSPRASSSSPSSRSASPPPLRTTSLAGAVRAPPPPRPEPAKPPYCMLGNPYRMLGNHVPSFHTPSQHPHCRWSSHAPQS
eukprot:4004276-Prymnesium_polylepis.1